MFPLPYTVQKGSGLSCADDTIKSIHLPYKLHVNPVFYMIHVTGEQELDQNAEVVEKKDI